MHVSYMGHELLVGQAKNLTLEITCIKENEEGISGFSHICNQTDKEYS